MSGYESISRRRFTRKADRAVVGGVCAGLADYFGFNLRVTRLLAFIALWMAFPVTVIAYFGAVFPIPSEHDPELQTGHDPEFERAVRSSPQQTLGDVRRRFQKLDRRLARLERYVTSSRFDLDQQFKNL